MNPRLHRYLQTGILVGLGLYLLVKIFGGTLYFYINERFLWLVALGAGIFFLLGQAVFFRGEERNQAAHSHAHTHDHHHHPAGGAWGLVIVALPLLLGFLVPAKPLDSAALDTRGITTNTALSLDSQSQAQELARPSDQRTVLDWVRAFNYASEPGIYTGETADVIGFVYHDDRLAANQFLVSRFTVTCCVADAFAVGVIVQSEEAAQWPGNTWVHVAGTIEVGSLDGNAAPLILAESIKEVPLPPQPYLFP